MLQKFSLSLDGSLGKESPKELLRLGGTQCREGPPQSALVAWHPGQPLPGVRSPPVRGPPAAHGSGTTWTATLTKSLKSAQNLQPSNLPFRDGSKRRTKDVHNIQVRKMFTTPFILSGDVSSSRGRDKQLGRHH